MCTTIAHFKMRLSRQSSATSMRWRLLSWWEVAGRLSPSLQPEVLVVLVLACAAILLARLNHDIAWFLVATRRLLAGDRLYVDIFEVNPPLIFWLMSPCASLGQLLGLSDSTTASILPVVMLTAVTFVSARVLSLAPAPANWLSSSMLCGFLVLASLVVLPDAGQRDHLAVVLLLPYGILCGRTSLGLQTPASVSICCGMLAATGVALKPFFLIPWLTAELVVVVRRRSLRACWRPDFALVVAGQCIYAVMILTLTPEYLTNMVPLARATYGAYETSRMFLISFDPFPRLTICALATLGASMLLPGPQRLASSETLAAMALGFLVSFVWQAKGWSYQLVPALVLAPVALLVASLNVVHFLLARQYTPQSVRRAAGAALICAASAGLVTPLIVIGTRRGIWSIRGDYPPVVRALANTVGAGGRGEPVYVLSTSVWPAFPVVNLVGAQWPFHYHALWPLPAFYRGSGDAGYHLPAQQSPEEHAFFETVVGDLVATPPRILIVDRSATKQAMSRPFEFVAYFSESPAFAALLERYRLLGRVGPFDVLLRN